MVNTNEKPDMSDLKISDTARKAAEGVRIPMTDLAKSQLEERFQLAINEACRPLGRERRLNHGKKYVKHGLQEINLVK